MGPTDRLATAFLAGIVVSGNSDLVDTLRAASVSSHRLPTVLLQIARAERRRCEFGWELRSDAEDCVDEVALR